MVAKKKRTVSRKSVASKKQPTTISDYIANYPKNGASRLRDIRKVIASEVPEAKEAIKYGIPTYVYNGNLISFAGYKRHIGMYPLPHAPSPELRMEMQPYFAEKSTLQFPHDKPLPLELIRKVVQARVKDSES
jgi:uncharacterized protein YdhG (YjbR/CyaY superfamily)